MTFCPRARIGIDPRLSQEQSYAPKNEFDQSDGVVFPGIDVCVWSECQGHDQ